MTTKQLITEYNDLARERGIAELTHWKQAGEKLRERIDAMRGADAQVMTDPLALPEAFGEPDPEQAEVSVAEEPGGADQEPVEASEHPAESAEVPAKSGRGGIGKLVASLLLDAEGFDYPTIVEMVAGEFPDAQTSTRSVASVAARLRKDGVEMPMRRKARNA